MQVEAGEVQVDVMEEGIEELMHLDRFLRKTRPPPQQASMLAVRPLNSQ